LAGTLSAPFVVRQVGLQRFERAAKAAATASEHPMIAIAAILVFLIVMFALNRFEFGRFD